MEGVIETGTLTAGNSVASKLQIEEIEFRPNGGTAVIWDVGLHNSDKIRISAKETGTPTLPGTCVIYFRLSI
jgi:hypothetical protein